MKFIINEHITIEAETYETRYSWGHKAWLFKDGYEIAYSKATYYNRTWERYQFESVIRSVVDKALKRDLSDQEREVCIKYIQEYQEPSPFRHVAMVAKMGEVLTGNKQEANDWKVRMLKAGLPEGAISMPDDWDTLSEEEKEDRLNKALEALK